MKNLAIFLGLKSQEIELCIKFVYFKTMYLVIFFTYTKYELCKFNIHNVFINYYGKLVL